VFLSELYEEGVADEVPEEFMEKFRVVLDLFYIGKG
jgi:hypothetical protein